MITNQQALVFYHELQSSNNFHQCFKVLVKYAKFLGFDGALYTYTPINVKEFKPIMLVSESYHEDYLSFYQKNNFGQADPIIDAIINKKMSYLNWFDYTEKVNLIGKSLDVMDSAREFNLRNGVSFALPAPYHILAAASFICRGSDALFEDICLPNIEQLKALAEFFHYRITFQKLHRQPFIEPLKDRLTPTKLHLLDGLKNGKNVKTIAGELGLSDKYTQNLVGEIRKDFHCTSRDQLIFLVSALEIV